MGDFFLVGDVDNRLFLPLRNVELSRESIVRALPARVDDLIFNLSKEDLVNLILDN